jgi:hypothetical protein
MRAVGRRPSVLLLSVLAACLCTAPAALAQTSLSIHPSFLPERLGASTSLTVSMRLLGGEHGVPPPLSGMVVHLPAGLDLNLSGVGICPQPQLRRRGAGGCPANSLLGRGSAVLKVHAGSQTLPEPSTIAVFRGADRASTPTFLIYGHGDSPLDESTISTAVLAPDSPPYGSKLTISIPRIPTLMLEPDASFSSMSLTIGNVKARPQAHAAGTISIPRSCPAGGFPFAVDVTFAEGSTAGARASLPCP